MPQASLELRDGIAWLKGPLDFDTVAELEPLGCEFIRQGGSSLLFSLKEVGFANSGAVALLLSWQRFARHSGKALAFADMPSQLRSLIDLSGLSELIQGAASN